MRVSCQALWPAHCPFQVPVDLPILRNHDAGDILDVAEDITEETEATDISKKQNPPRLQYYPALKEKSYLDLDRDPRVCNHPTPPRKFIPGDSETQRGCGRT